jgi:hypothetical protein
MTIQKLYLYRAYAGAIVDLFNFEFRLCFGEKIPSFLYMTI